MFQNLSCVLWFNPLWKEPRLTPALKYATDQSAIKLTNTWVKIFKFQQIQSYTKSLCCSSFGNLYLTCVFICFCIFSVIILNVTGCGSRWAGLTEYLTRPCVNLVVMYSTLLPPCFHPASTLLPPCFHPAGCVFHPASTSENMRFILCDRKHWLTNRTVLREALIKDLSVCWCLWDRKD